MTLLTTGETLDKHGQPIEGTGFEYESDGRLAQLLNQRTSPILSRPDAGEWFFEINQEEGDHRSAERVVGIARPGNIGPPEHIHPIYAEHVEVVQGEFELITRSGHKRYGTGATYVIEKDLPHSVRAGGETFAVALLEIRPASTFGLLIRNFYGLDHDGELSPTGELKFLQAMVFASTFVDNTIFTTPPPAISVPLARILTPLARFAGYQGRNPRYEEDGFWFKHVAQPEMELAYSR